MPKTPRDLERHNLLQFNFSRTHENWPFIEKDKKIIIKPKGNVAVSDGESMRQLALNGVGLARLAQFQVQADIEAGRLIPVLQQYNPKDSEPL